MSDKTKRFDLVLLVAVIAIIAAITGGIIGYNNGKASCPECNGETIVVERIDTVTLVGPRDTLTRIVWKPYPVHDTVNIGDTTFLMLPYEHRHYSSPDTLDVWYSGVDPRIDSTRVYVRNTTITNTVYQTDYKMPRLTLDLGAGALYFDKGINPYLLGELRYNAKKTTFAAFGAIDHTGRWGAGINITYQINLIK